MASVTLQQLETRVYDQLDANNLEFAEPFVRAAINQGLFRLNVLLGFSQATLPIAGNFTVQGQRQYPVPAGILIPLRLDFEGQELDRVSLSRLGRAYRTWAVDSTRDLGPVARWASIGLSQFVIHPIDALGGNSIEVTGIANLVPLAAPTDTILLDDQWQEIVVRFAKVRVMAKEPGKPFADIAQQLKDFWRGVQAQMIWKGVETPHYWLRKQQRPSSGRGR